MSQGQFLPFRTNLSPVESTECSYPLLMAQMVNSLSVGTALGFSRIRLRANRRRERLVARRATRGLPLPVAQERALEYLSEVDTDPLAL